MWTWHVQIGERLVIWCRNREPLRWLQFPSLLLVRLPWNLTPRKVKRETTRSPATCCPPVHQLGKDDHAFLPAPSTRPAHPSPSQPISAVALPDPVVGPAYLQLIWAVHFVNKPTGPGGDLTMGPTQPAHRDRQLGRGSEWTPPDSSYIPISLCRSDWVRRSSGMCFGIDSCLICCNLIRWFDRLRCDRFGVSGYAGCGLWVLGFRSIWRRSWREIECPWVSVCLLFESFPVVLFWRALISIFSVIFVRCIFIFSLFLIF
jgi:hypothetical protein